jgi:hypothetical protein
MVALRRSDRNVSLGIWFGNRSLRGTKTMEFIEELFVSEFPEASEVYEQVLSDEWVPNFAPDSLILMY